jgi:ribosomal protein L35
MAKKRLKMAGSGASRLHLAHDLIDGGKPSKQMRRLRPNTCVDRSRRKSSGEHRDPA